MSWDCCPLERHCQASRLFLLGPRNHVMAHCAVCRGGDDRQTDMHVLLFTLLWDFCLVLWLGARGRERALQDDLGVAEEGADVPGVVDLQEGERSRLVPEHVLPFRVIAHARVTPLSPETRPHRLCRLHLPVRFFLASAIHIILLRLGCRGLISAALLMPGIERALGLRFADGGLQGVHITRQASAGMTI